MSEIRDRNNISLSLLRCEDGGKRLYAQELMSFNLRDPRHPKPTHRYAVHERVGSVSARNDCIYGIGRKQYGVYHPVQNLDMTTPLKGTSARRGLSDSAMRLLEKMVSCRQQGVF